ncbi:hypothetical protein [uncultured Psychromonas sp.]|uniref:hypothetical protein n=1 Tax=uncultured Psychromonas sp. TaxID=173974 RepID=UPI00261D5CAA|nr:hypothetical protein [uncultured Psychromonas sp.]
MWSGNLAPWVVEESYKYYISSVKVRDLGYVSDVLAALSIEIIFKSYLCKEIQVNQGVTYKFDSKLLNKEYKEEGTSSFHDLFLLAKSLPEEVQFLLFKDSDKGSDKDRFSDFLILKERRNTFSSSRYLYESKNKTGSSTILSNLALEYIEKTISLYKEKECDDWWIKNYPEV